MTENVRGLIPFEQAPEDLRVEMEKIKQQNYEEALTNLITGKTPPKDFPNGKIPRRPARGGIQVDYVPGWWFVKQANALFNHFWDMEVIEHAITPERQIWAKVRVTIKVPGKTRIIRHPDGLIEEVRVDPIEISKTQFGSSDVKMSKETNKPLDIGDDLKGAATDGMKKCFVSFGFAADVYGTREVLEQAAATGKQLSVLYSRGLSRGLQQDGVDELSRKEFNKPPGQLEQVEILGLLAKIDKMPKIEDSTQ